MKLLIQYDAQDYDTQIRLQRQVEILEMSANETNLCY